MGGRRSGYRGRRPRRPIRVRQARASSLPDPAATLPAWYPFDALHFFDGLAREASRCVAVEFATAPYIATMLAEFGGSNAARERVTRDELARWRQQMREATRAHATDLLSMCRASEDGAAERYFAAMLFIFEMATRGREVALVHTESIATGNATLDSVLRSLNLGPAPTIALEPVDETPRPSQRPDLDLDRQLATMSKLTSGALEVPIPAEAVTLPRNVTTFVPDSNVVVTALFVVPIPSDVAFSFYERWACASGWIVEHLEQSPIEASLVLVRHGQNLVFVFSVLDGVTLLRVGIRPGRTATFLPYARIQSAS